MVKTSLITKNSIVEECWHGHLSFKKAEVRLLAVNKAKSNLFRESEVKRNRFILSYISDKDCGIFKHIITQTPTKKAFPVYLKPPVWWKG